MDAQYCIRETLKEVRDRLKKVPDHPWLKKLKKRFETFLKEQKDAGYSQEFEKFWKACPNPSGSKPAAYEQWHGADQKWAMNAIKEYIKACGKAGHSTVHAERYLRDEYYEGYSNKSVKRKVSLCYFCQKKPVVKTIGLTKFASHIKYRATAEVCGDCARHEGEDINAVQELYK